MKLDRKARKRKQREETREVKKRRIQLKEERCNSQYQRTTREGTTYEQDVGLWNSSDVEEILPATEAPKREVLAELNSMTQIIFDVETTSLGNLT